MASIEITHAELIVHVTGWDKVLALRSTLRVPLTHVKGARARPVEARFDDVIVESWRGIGTYVPGRFAAGIVYLPDGRAFYDVHDPGRAIAIDLEHDEIHHVVVEVDDEEPEGTVARILKALARAAREAKEPSDPVSPAPRARRPPP